jgi:hypothetical protein
MNDLETIYIPRPWRPWLQRMVEMFIACCLCFALGTIYENRRNMSDNLRPRVDRNSDQAFLNNRAVLENGWRMDEIEERMDRAGVPR